MSKMRVLHIKGTLSSDGATVVEYSFAKQLVDSIVFDWLLDTKPDVIWKQKFTELGSKVYHVKYKHSQVKLINIFHKYYAYKSFFKEHSINTIHIDTDGFHRVVELFAAKIVGVSKRIIHSHNTKAEVNGLLSKRKSLIKLGQMLYLILATDYVACSDKAGDWLFGKNNKTLLLKNGIDAQRFRFNPQDRFEARNELGINNCIVYGHVGRFEKQKNHKFLIRVFKELYKRNKSSRLLLIGDGSLKNELINLVKSEQLESAVLFLGNVDNVEYYYNAMDLFLFPSLFEGFGIVAIEAQCNGLPVIMSRAVPEQTKINQNCVSLSLNNIMLWVDKAEQMSSIINRDRNEMFKLIESAHYDIQSTSKMLLDVYRVKENKIR